MRLITNKISTGKPGRFEDFIENFRASQVKTASVKTAEEKDEAESSGQLKVEPLHQTGESTTMPKNGPSAKKDDGEKAATVNTDTEKDGEDSDQPAWEGKQENNNKPEVEKEASTKCADCGCSEGACKCEEPCKACMAKAQATQKTAGELPEALKEHMFKKKDDKDDKDDDGGETKPATDSDDDTDVESKVKEEDKETKEASHKCDDCDCDPCTCKDKKASKSVKFVKWANLDSKNKSFLTTYWRQLFGDDYVDALVSDK